jgi:hypothetical protein
MDTGQDRSAWSFVMARHNFFFDLHSQRGLMHMAGDRACFRTNDGLRHVANVEARIDASTSSLGRGARGDPQFSTNVGGLETHISSMAAADGAPSSTINRRCTCKRYRDRSDYEGNTFQPLDMDDGKEPLPTPDYLEPFNESKGGHYDGETIWDYE